MSLVPPFNLQSTTGNPRDKADRAAMAFLARYSGVTRRNYGSDVRVWFRWCADHEREVLQVRRVEIELWARDMEEAMGLARSTVSHRLSTICGFYRFAHIDGTIDKNPARHVRRPKVEPDSTTLGLDRTELAAFIFAAEALGPHPHALACRHCCIGGSGLERPA